MTSERRRATGGSVGRARGDRTGVGALASSPLVGGVARDDRRATCLTLVILVSLVSRLVEKKSLDYDDDRLGGEHRGRRPQSHVQLILAIRQEIDQI